MSRTVQAPTGARFDDEEVRTAKGTQSLGLVPILVWEDHEAMAAHYGAQGLLDMADGTSLRVSFQSIARRFKAAEKSDDEIANAQIAYRPGKRAAGVSTPESRAARSARAAVEKTGNSEAITALLDKISRGEISAEDLAQLTS